MGNPNRYLALPPWLHFHLGNADRADGSSGENGCAMMGAVANRATYAVTPFAEARVECAALRCAVLRCAAFPAQP